MRYFMRSEDSRLETSRSKPLVVSASAVLPCKSTRPVMICSFRVSRLQGALNAHRSDRAIPTCCCEDTLLAECGTRPMGTPGLADAENHRDMIDPP